MKMYITFGQVHVHSVHGETFDKDCVAVINGIDEDDCNRLAWLYFDGVFHQHEIETHWNMDKMKVFPRGLIEVNPQCQS